MRFDKIHDQDFLITVPTAKKCAFWKQQNGLLAKNYQYTEIHTGPPALPTSPLCNRDRRFGKTQVPGMIFEALMQN